MRLLQIHPQDTVAVDYQSGHKVALRDIAAGENIIKYGFPIGHATRAIRKGEVVHVDNIKTNLNEEISYEYKPEKYALPRWEGGTVLAYERGDGQIGIRNDVWIVNTVGCVNSVAQEISRRTGALCFSHPYGCSQLGEDHGITEKILCGLVHHPNAGGVLVLGLGCENNNIPRFQKKLGCIDERRVKFLAAQDCEDEIREGVRLVCELQSYAAGFHRTEVSVSRLKVGLKCGGSDGFSGITANPLTGQYTNRLVAAGGSAVLTEVPEMFGAETILMNRCADEEVFHKTVKLIQSFKEYFISHGQPVYENPSPGNKEGGISTLEDKSLGCTQKGGIAPVVDVLDYGQRVEKCGLNLLNGPGNDMVAVTNLTAAGCHLILFTTGRGTPLGAPVPTIKIASNSKLAKRKPDWIDFDAGPVADGADLEKDLWDYVVKVVNGQETCNERNGYREIAIFKDGVIL